MTDTADRVKKAIAEQLAIDPERVPLDPDEVTTDSLEKIEIGMALEDEFGIDEISDDEIEHCVSLGDYIDMIEKHLAGSEVA